MDPFDTKMPLPVSRTSSDSESLPLEEPALRWEKEDFEQRLGFTGGRYTGVNRLLSFMIALACTLAFYLVIHLVFQPRTEPAWMPELAAKFTQRGITPYPTMFLFFWGCVILFIKARKLAYQRRALTLMPVPQNPEFVLTPETAKVVLRRIDSLVDSSTHFILLNRIHNAISNLRNIGSVGDVTNVLKSQSENDDDQVQSSYSLLSGFNWAIPVLGFIGTVLGLGEAIGGFGATLSSAGDVSTLKDSLKGVTGGLSTSFDTTLVALVAALYIQLRVTFLQQQEYAFLDDCNDYCQKYVVSRLKLVERGDD